MKHLRQYIRQLLHEYKEEPHGDDAIDVKLIKTFLDEMPHGIHLAEVVGRVELLKTFEEIHAEANGLLKIWEERTKLNPAPGVIDMSKMRHWMDGYQKIRSLLRDDLWGKYIKFEEVVHAMTPVYNRLVDSFSPMRLQPEYADWFYEWTGRDQP